MTIRSLTTTNRGFSLTEVMVSVAIVGVLATLGVQSYQGLMTKSRYASSLTTMSAIKTSIVALRFSERKTLPQLTGSSCTFCDQQITTGQNVGTTAPVWNASIARIWATLGFAANPTDGWGRPIILDENELEFGASDCRHDALWTVGPDGVWGGPGAGDTAYGDDKVMQIPFYKQAANCP